MEVKMALLKKEKDNNSAVYKLFGILPIFKKTIKTPVIKDNTFIVWEPCSMSHSEVVPGYVKYLADLGYHVSVLVNPKRIKEGLFSRFDCENVTLNNMSNKQIREYFLYNNLENVKGVLVTTVGKLCDSVHYEECFEHFHPDTDRKKLFFVEHEACHSVDNNTWDENLITLRKLDYKGAKSVVINPHYFGKTTHKPKNKIVNFITIGAIRPNKKNSQMIINTALELYKKGYRDFKITSVGKKGKIKNFPKEIRKFIDMKGRLPFNKMYDEIERADYIITAYNEFDPEHIRYNSSGTSGNFQLVYGFNKPCIILKSYAPINGFNNKNAILYNKDEDYTKAFIKAIDQSDEEYEKMCDSLKNLQEKIYKKSFDNFKKITKGL